VYKITFHTMVYVLLSMYNGSAIKTNALYNSVKL